MDDTKKHQAKGTKPVTKEKYCVTPLTCEVPKIVKFIKTQSQMVVARCLGTQDELGSYCLVGMEFQFGKMENVLEMGGGDGYTQNENIFNAIKLNP